MSENYILEEKLLRFAAPELYKKMAETFANLNIHPYDVHGTLRKNDRGLELTLRFSPSFSQSVSTQVSNEQVVNPDEEMIQFFEEAAQKCKAQLISDYYKMIKL